MLATSKRSIICSGVTSPPFNSGDVNSLRELLIPTLKSAILKRILFIGSTSTALKPAKPANSSPNSKRVPYASAFSVIAKRNLFIC